MFLISVSGFCRTLYLFWVYTTENGYASVWISTQLQRAYLYILNSGKYLNITELYLHPSEVVEVGSTVVGASCDGWRELQHRMRGWVIAMGHHLYLTHLGVPSEAYARLKTYF